jgi:hypothetical protein
LIENNKKSKKVLDEISRIESKIDILNHNSQQLEILLDNTSTPKGMHISFKEEKMQIPKSVPKSKPLLSHSERLEIQKTENICQALLGNTRLLKLFQNSLRTPRNIGDCLNEINQNSTKFDLK